MSNVSPVPYNATTLDNFSLQRKLDDLVDKGYVHRSDITDHIMQALEGKQKHTGLQHCKHLLCY